MQKKFNGFTVLAMRIDQPWQILNKKIDNTSVLPKEKMHNQIIFRFLIARTFLVTKRVVEIIETAFL